MPVLNEREITSSYPVIPLILSNKVLPTFTYLLKEFYMKHIILISWYFTSLMNFFSDIYPLDFDKLILDPPRQ